LQRLPLQPDANPVLAQFPRCFIEAERTENTLPQTRIGLPAHRNEIGFKSTRYEALSQSL